MEQKLKPGQILKLKGLAIYDRGRIFNGEMTVRVNSIDDGFSSAEITVISGSEPGIVGIDHVAEIREITRCIAAD